MDQYSKKLQPVILLAVLFLSSCTIYTEKRSEALSQAVFATSDSITHARFDLASRYSKEAEKLAFPPKNRIKINPVYTTEKDKTEKTKNILINVKDSLSAPSSIVASGISQEEDLTVLRLIIPEHLKHAKLLIENSEEWNDLIETKEFSNKLKEDNENLRRLSDDVNKELQRQTEMNSKLISDLKDLQKRVAEKNLAILKRNVIIGSLILIMAGGIYLRIKGIF